MSNPYDPHNAPTSFPGQQPPPPQQPYPPQQFPQQPYPQQPYPTQQPSPPQPYPQQPYPPQQPSPPQQYPQQYPPGFGGPPPARSKAPLVIGAVVLVLVLLGGAVGGFFLLRDGDGDGDDAAEEGSSQTDDPAEEPSDEPAADPVEEPAEPEPTEPIESEPAEPDPADPGAGFDPALTPVVGLWTGTYTCGQGVSKLDLAIAPSASGDGALDAVFEFGPTSDYPDVPVGSFLMTGFFTDGALALNGYQWVEQPDDYELVDLVATVDGELPETIEGEITTAGCESFSVSRTTG